MTRDNMRVITLAALACACALAQSATVVRIDKTDAAAVQKKHEAYLAAKAEYEKAEAAIRLKYTADNQSFLCGVEFTPDFTLAVPKPCETKTPWNGLMVTPAVNAYSN